MTQRYHPWGTVRSGSGNALPTGYTFTGQLDTGVGLMVYSARLYDAALARFIQPDTIVPEPGNPQALNRYSYVLNTAWHRLICITEDCPHGRPPGVQRLVNVIFLDIMCVECPFSEDIPHTDFSMNAPNHLTRLFNIAEAQAGYFTTAQAASAGIDRRRLAYYAGAGRLQRIRHGIYRLTQFPHSRHEDLFIAWLTAGPHAVISHESALLLYDLSDVLPEAIHVTVPRSASRRRPGLRIHTNDIGADDITQREGLPVTTVPRTIVDVALAGLSDEFVLQATREALYAGLTTPEQLLAKAEPRSARLAYLLRTTLMKVGAA